MFQSNATKLKTNNKYNSKISKHYKQSIGQRLRLKGYLKYVELNKYENKLIKLYDIKLRKYWEGTFKKSSNFYRKWEKYQINNLIYHLKKLEESQNKTHQNHRKETIQERRMKLSSGK